jgi:5-formyltetrahydrofolate cyclo-ligase
MLQTAKADLRRASLSAARTAANAYGKEAGTRVARAFLEAVNLRPGAVVAGYAPLKGEIDPTPLLERLSETGHPIALPLAERPGDPLVFRRWRPGERLQVGQFGAREPDRAAPLLKPDAVIVPLVAFDRQGYRLGRGGGFYDRTLAELRAGGLDVTVGLAFSVQEAKDVPREPHDARLDWVVTEEGAIRIASH